MGFLPAIIALCSFLLLWALFNSNQLKKRLEIIQSLRNSKKELEDYFEKNKIELIDRQSTLARNDMDKELTRAANLLNANIKDYNRSISKKPVKFLADLLGYKPITD
jgi:hypothetical protein